MLHICIANVFKRPFPPNLIRYRRRRPSSSHLFELTTSGIIFTRSTIGKRHVRPPRVVCSSCLSVVYSVTLLSDRFLNDGRERCMEGIKSACLGFGDASVPLTLKRRHAFQLSKQYSLLSRFFIWSLTMKHDYCMCFDPARDASGENQSLIMADRRKSMDRRPSIGRSSSVLAGEGKNHIVFGVPKGEYLPDYFKSMKKHLPDQSLEIVTYMKDDLKKKLKPNAARYLCIIIPPEMMKGGMIDTIREDAPGVPVYGYGNEPSGKYKKDIDVYQGKLDGPCLNGPSLLPGNKGQWDPKALVNLVAKAGGKSGGGGGPAPAPERRKSIDRKNSAGGGATPSPERRKSLDRKNSAGGMTMPNGMMMMPNGMMMPMMPGMPGMPGMGGMPGSQPGMGNPGGMPGMGSMPGSQLPAGGMPGMPGMGSMPGSQPLAGGMPGMPGMGGMPGSQTPAGGMPGMGGMPGTPNQPPSSQSPGMHSSPGGMSSVQVPAGGMPGQPQSMSQNPPGMGGMPTMMGSGGMGMAGPQSGQSPAQQGMPFPMGNMPGMTGATPMGNMPGMPPAGMMGMPGMAPATPPKPAQALILPAHLPWKDSEKAVMESLSPAERQMIIALKEEINSLRNDIKAIDGTSAAKVISTGA